MINYLWSLRHNPGKGWDPVPKNYVLEYAERVWNEGVEQKTVDQLEKWIDGFKGKRILDLGSGPGQWSIYFAKKGADVTCYDVSKNYQDFIRQKALEYNVSLNYCIGYLDEARKKLDGEFDLVFNRVCWYYAWSDFSFAKIIYALTKPGGYGYIDTHPSTWCRHEASAIRRMRLWLNDRLGIKLGVIHTPHNRIAKLFLEMPVESMFIDYTSEAHDCVFFKKRSV